MSVNIELPPQVEQAYRDAAQAKGMPLDALVRQVLIDRQPANDSAEERFERGLGLFGSPGDAALLDEVVAIAYQERRRPTLPIT